MEMHQLRYFVALAETGSFSRAARRCFVSQPSLSQQIIKLEQEVGLPLLERTGRQTKLTEAGDVLLERARRVLATIDDAEQRLHDLRRGGPRQLSVGVIPTMAPFLLPPVVAAYARSRPEIALTIYEETTARLVEAVATGAIDLGIASLPIDEPRVETELLGEEAFVAALPAGHPRAAESGLALESLRDEPFVLMQDVHCLSEQVIELCRSRRFLPRVVCRGAQVATVQALVGLGMGVSLLPAMAREREGALVYRELDGGSLVRPVAALWRAERHRSEAVRAFAEAVRDALSAR